MTTFNRLINKHCNFKNIYIILYKVLLKQKQKQKELCSKHSYCGYTKLPPNFDALVKKNLFFLALPVSQSFGDHVLGSQKWVKSTFGAGNPRGAWEAWLGCWLTPCLSVGLELQTMWSPEKPIFPLSWEGETTHHGSREADGQGGCPVAGASLSCFAGRSESSGPTLVSPSWLTKFNEICFGGSLGFFSFSFFYPPLKAKTCFLDGL